jgi:hypothetical protein
VVELLDVDAENGIRRGRRIEAAEQVIAVDLPEPLGPMTATNSPPLCSDQRRRLKRCLSRP